MQMKIEIKLVRKKKKECKLRSKRKKKVGKQKVN